MSTDNQTNKTAGSTIIESKDRTALWMGIGLCVLIGLPMLIAAFFR